MLLIEWVDKALHLVSVHVTVSNSEVKSVSVEYNSDPEDFEFKEVLTVEVLLRKLAKLLWVELPEVGLDAVVNWAAWLEVKVVIDLLWWAVVVDVELLK